MNIDSLHLSQWHGAAQDMVYMLMQEPPTNAQFLIFVVASFMACRWTFIRVVHAMNLNDVGFLYHFITTAVGTGSIVFALAAVKIYMPEWLDSPDSLFYIVGVIAAASIVLSVPLINCFMRENYFKTLLAWSVSLVAVVGTVLIMGVLADAFVVGLSSFDKGARHNAETKELLK